MAHLSLTLLGSFQVTLDGQPVTGFKSNKVRALLAYLAVEADRPHRREVLAGLLWPDWPDRDAMSSLRYTLSDLRQAIGDREADPPYLLISRETLQFNQASGHWLDVAAFTELVAGDRGHPHITEHLAEAVGLVHGDFLEGFTVGDSPVFEEWVLLTRERLARQVSSALHELAAIHERRGEYGQAQAWAWRQLELEPWDEAAHQALMRALALGGQRSAALAQYESCRRVLAEELGVEPGEETTRWYQQIRDGKLRAPGPPPGPPSTPVVRLPPFLEGQPAEVERPVFVARERELGLLDRHLALAGRGRVVFVTGEAGSGKTALLQEFSRHAQDNHSDLVVASGNCNAYTGIGDPYLPFREILELLTGDVEARWTAGAMTRDHAHRLWHTLPHTAQALLDTGPDLIDTFVPRPALLQRAATYTQWSGTADWPERLHGLVQRWPVGILASPSGSLSVQQSDLFEQYTRVLQVLAQRRPLLLLLDDLQWADLGSISLLFHLGRHLAGSRVLVVGAYRPEEVTLGRDGGRHPLEAVVNEFQRAFGDIMVNLGQAESRDFVESLLDSEPNRLTDTFREMLYRQTRGHPLFTVELLRGMQERGDLVQDHEGRWVEGPTLNWETLPARVEAVIAERIARLPQPLRAALQAASVEGELFTAEVVARVGATSEREMLGHLSDDLDRRHRLIRAQSILRVDSQPLSRYRFRHILFQKYLYGTLDAVERVHLHEQVGRTLEALYGDQEQAGDVAVQLAVHFQRARIPEKAIHYRHLAGEKAIQLSAYQEAITHLTRGLELLEPLPDSRQRAEQELALTISLGLAWKGYIPGPEGEHALTRARELCQQLGKTTQLCRVLGELAIRSYVRAEYQTARALGEEALELACQVQNPLLVMLGHWQVGFILFGLGEFTAAHAHLQEVISLYDPQEHHHPFLLARGSDAGVSALAYDACSLWCLGYPEQAAKLSQEALLLARRLAHPFTLADVLCYAGCVLHKMRRDAHALRDDAEEFTQLSERMDFLSFKEIAFCSLGEALAMLGQPEEGIAQMREGMVVRLATDARVNQSGILDGLAKAQVGAGRPQQALVTLAEALAVVEETGERYCEAELHRQRGELLLAQGDESAAEASFHRAIAVARHQQAKSWELRATVSLCRLWRDQGKSESAHQALAAVYDWFTEGFDTPDLVAARALLDALSA
jgi:predicted ATPase/DNA-binding SARP family transcriptional activator